MSPAQLLRLAGLLAMVSAALSVLGDLLTLVVDVENPTLAASTSYAVVFGLYLLATVLLLLGLVGIYLHEAAAAGIVGVVGFLTAFAGTALVVGAIWFELFITPPLAVAAPSLADTELGLPGFILSFLLTGIGWLVFGVATFRARVYPRGAAILLIAGAVLSFIPIPLAGSVLSLAVAWLGFVLFTSMQASRAQPALAT